jgi:hypothetical protein
MTSRNFATVLLGTALAAGAPSMARAQQVTPPARHVVQAGETLWGLAQLYFGDPFLWPEIYRLNTAVVEDPHWIFPGEELVLAADQTNVAVAEPVAQPTPPPAAVTAAPPVTEPPVTQPPVTEPPVTQPPVAQPPTVEAPAAVQGPPPPPMATSATVFARSARSNIPAPVAVPPDTYRAVRSGEFYSAGFLTENEKLPWAEVVGNADLAAPRGIAGTSAMIYQRVRVRPPQGAAYQVGDSLLTAWLSRGVSGYGEIVNPSGIVRVVKVEEKDVEADVVLQFGRIGTGQVALPLEPFKDPGAAHPAPVADGVQGHIIAMREVHPVPKEFDVVFIDLGRNAGIAPGDVFEILPRKEAVPEGAEPQTLAEVRVVHVRERSATALVSQIYTLGIRTAGREAVEVPVRLIRKMPS